jgi:putative colanic acid biosysnthesis UDP-glucose lipid carrier transferase
MLGLKNDAWPAALSGDQRPRMPVAASLAKRMIDLAIAWLALLLFAPLMFLAAAAIWLESGGPILFRQTRGGLGGRPFTIYKFRTMRVADNGRVIRQVTENDVRVTLVGRLLRKFSVDELPQLLNVLSGDMSIVGPRPHALAHDAMWAAAVPRYAERFRAKPGLTGLAQVSGHRGLVRELAQVRLRTAADNTYIDEWRLSLDLKLILRTVPLVFHDPAAF